MQSLCKSLFILTFFILVCSQPLFAEWKTEGWKAGDNFWWTYGPGKSCNYSIEAWRIDGINDDVVKIVRKNDNKIEYRELKKMHAFPSEKSAKENIEFFEKKCKEEKSLKERYENQ